MSANTQEEILSGILPKVIINKITISNATELQEQEGINTFVFSKKINVDINFIIKETLDKNQFGTWFNDVNIAKFVKVQIIQSINPIVTDILSFSNDMIQLVNLNGSTARFLTEDMRLKAASYISQIGNIEEIENLINNNISCQTISLATNNNLENYSAYQNRDGNLIYEIPYEVSYRDIPGGVEHLSYFIVSRIDFDELCAEFNIDRQFASSLEENGRVASEVVIDKFNVVDYSYIYVDKNGETWDGAVHLDQNGNWKSGDDESESSIQLTQITINNNKVQDFRNLEEIQKKLIDFNEELKESSAKFEQINKLQSLSLRNNNALPIFSDLFLTRDSNNFIKFIFAVDFNNAMKQFSPLSKLFDSKNDRFNREIIEASRILNITICKRRIKNNINKSQDLAQFELEEFEDSRLNYPLVASKDASGWKTLGRSENSRSILKEENVFTKTSINTGPPYSIRYFSATDMEFSLPYSEGLYQYGVDLQIEDGTVKFISNKINLLNEGKNRLLEYYNLVSTPTMKKFFLETDEPHIETSKNNSFNPAIISHGYDILSNKISDALAQRIEQSYNNPATSPWVKQSADYVDILDIFSQTTLTQQDKQNYINILQNYLNPRSANPSSILKVIELYDQFISLLSKLIKINPNSGNTNSLSNSSVSQREFKIFKISNMFKNIIDSSVIKKYGVDFLSYSKSQTASKEMIYLGIREFSIRIDNEIKKYYISSPSLTVNINNRLVNLQNLSGIDELSFLSPTRFDFPDKSMYVSPFGEDVDTLTANYQQPRSSISSLYTGDIYENISSLLSDILEIKLSNIGNNPRQSTYSVGNNVFRLTNRQRIIEELKQIYSLYGSTIINNFNINQNNNETTPARIDREQRFSTIATSDPGEPREQQDAESLLQFLSNIAYFNAKNQKSSFKYTNNFSDYKTSLFSYLIQDPIKNLIKSDFINVSNSTFNSMLTLPTPLKALAVKSQNFIPLLLNSRDYSEFNNVLKNRLLNYLYFENMMRVEYLDTLEPDNSNGQVQTINVKNPTWKTLTRERYNSIGPQNKILCRLTGYSNFMLKIKTDKDVEETAYDKYFLLQGSSQDTTGVSITSVRRNTETQPALIQESDMISSNLVREIINNIKDVFPNAGLKEAGIKLDNIKNIPKMIEIATVDQRGVKNITNIDTTLTEESNKVPERVNSNSAEILIQSISLDRQTRSIKPTSISNNTVPNVSIKYLKTKQPKGRKR